MVGSCTGVRDVTIKQTTRSTAAPSQLILRDEYGCCENCTYISTMHILAQKHMYSTVEGHGVQKLASSYRRDVGKPGGTVRQRYFSDPHGKQIPIPTLALMTVNISYSSRVFSA